MDRAVSYIVKRTSEIEPGDVVVCFGMRCYVETAPSDKGNAPDVFSTRTLVLNRADVSFDYVPRSFTYDEKDGLDHWTIQGNDLAQWYIEAK